MSSPKDRLSLISGHISGGGSEENNNDAKHHEEDKPRLCCKVCIITGAASEKGIGRATAWAFAKNGAKAIYVTDYFEESLLQLAKDIQTKYPKVTVIPRKVDAASEDNVKSVIDDAIKKFGRLDVFFANAGILRIRDLYNLEPSTFMEVMRVNVLSVFLAIQNASTAMKITGNDKKQSGGSIIATASVAGLRSGAGPIDYSASKAAVINMVQVGACLLTNTNIRVNSINPGIIETNMTKLMFDNARANGKIGKVGQLNPLQRYATPDEIANVALFLASDESSYINGHALTVDGGLSASTPIVIRKNTGTPY